jgi:hypothetical protein
MDASSSASSRLHFSLVSDAILRGRLVPFLGAGVNLCDRPHDLAWNAESTLHLPNGNELANELAKQVAVTCPNPCTYERCPMPRDLAHTSQQLVTFLDEGPLYELLHNIFSVNVLPTSAHRFIASLSKGNNKAQRRGDRHQLIVTTNYDDLMERALNEAQVSFDLVFFDPDIRPGGGFCPRNPKGAIRAIEDANGDATPFCEERPVLLKVHGTVQAQREHEGFVITEDQYIEYLSEAPLETLLPSTLLAKLRDNHLLFLGYSLRDWNSRVFLRRLKRSPRHKFRSWAVMLSAHEAEQRFWTRNGVDVVVMVLNEYFELLKGELVSRGPENGAHPS